MKQPILHQVIRTTTMQLHKKLVGTDLRNNPRGRDLGLSFRRACPLLTDTSHLNSKSTCQIFKKSTFDPFMILPHGVLQMTVHVRRKVSLLVSGRVKKDLHPTRAESPELRSAKINFTLSRIMLVLKLKLMRSAELRACVIGPR